MQTVEVVKKVLHHQDIKVILKNNEFKMKGPGNKQAFNLDAEGVRRFISQNYDYISTRHNGSSQNIMSLLAVNSEELSAAINEVKEESKEVDPEKSETLEYFKNLSKLIFTKAKTDKERYFIFNELTQKEEEFHDIKTIETEFMRAYRFNPEAGKSAFQAWGEASEKYCVPTFDQRKPKLIEVDRNLKQWEYNYYNIPEYRLLDNYEIDRDTVSLVVEYFKHLIPDDYQRDYVFAWLYTTLTSRQETFLCLMGAQGVGKTLFMDLWINLHGLSNSVRPKDPTSQFNHYLTSKSAVCYDEVTVLGTGKEIFKRIANKNIQVERKGEDQKDVVNTASIMLATNYYYNIEVEPRDRRFSMPDLGKIPLEKGLGKGKASTLFKLIEDPKFLNWFYSWLLRKYGNDPRCNNDGEFSPTSPLKNTKTFEICCNVNAPDEVKFIFKLFKEKDAKGEAKIKTIELTDLIKKYKLEQKKETSNYKRINKHSIFYDREMFTDTMNLYTVEGEPVAIFKGEETIVNNILDFDLEEEKRDTGIMD